MHAAPLLLFVLAIMAIAYRLYSVFLATRVACNDPNILTPAVRLDDGQNYHPTNRWILFGHHFAAISGAGPLIGPVLAIQFGYMPGLIWLVIGVCLAGAVQDFLVLSASVRFEGKSLAQMARELLGPRVGLLASAAILFIVIIALSGLGIVVVKALGGESVPMVAGAKITFPGELEQQPNSSGIRLQVPPGSTIEYTIGPVASSTTKPAEQGLVASSTTEKVERDSNAEPRKASFKRSETFTMQVPPNAELKQSEGGFIVPAKIV